MTKPVANEISMDAVVAAVLTELVGIFTLKRKEQHRRLFYTNMFLLYIQLALARVK